MGEFITPDYRDAVKQVLDRALMGEEAANFEFPLITKDGKRVEVLLNATSRRDARDDITGVVGIGQDITQFLSQQQEYTRLIENANAPIFGVSRDGKVNIWNQKIAQITGFAPNVVLGQSLVDNFIRSTEKAAVEDVLERAISGIETDSFELPLQTQGKELVTLLLNASSKKDNTGQITGVVGVGQDFTARKKMEQAKTAFLASFSHELRTPLNGLLGMLELLLEQDLADEAHRQVTLARTCSTLLLNLINDILDLSKIEAGQPEIARQPFNLCTALEGAAQLVRMQAEARGIELVVDIRNVPQVVVGDALRLRQIVLNLLSNAIKFTKEGTIWVRCWPDRKDSMASEGHKVWFEVEDTGVGMHASDCAKLFTLFTKISDTRVSNPAGSGLGLAICKQLVTLMNGRISVTSEYGSGSKFTFHVMFDRAVEGERSPDADNAAEANQVEDSLGELDKDETLSKLSQDMGCQGASILVAEDNPFNLEVVRTFIEMASMTCTWAPNGQRVLDLYKESTRSYDLILMDCQMPIMDGYAATRAIREYEKKEGEERIPIVGLTAFAMSGDREKCIDCGMDNYLTKPIGKGALIRTIATHKRVHQSPAVPRASLGSREKDAEKETQKEALGTSMIDATLLTRDAAMMAPGCFRDGSGAEVKKRGSTIVSGAGSGSGTDDAGTEDSPVPHRLDQAMLRGMSTSSLQRSITSSNSSHTRSTASSRSPAEDPDKLDASDSAHAGRRSVSRVTRHTNVKAASAPVPQSPLNASKPTFTAPATASVMLDSSASETESTPTSRGRVLDGAGTMVAQSKSNDKSNAKGEAKTTTSGSDSAPNPALADLLKAGPPIDEAAAKKQFGSARMVQTMLKRFASYLPESIQKLRDAHAAKDFEALHAQGHSLKGSSSFVAAKELCDVATKIQNMCRPEAVSKESAEALTEQLAPLMERLEISSKRVSAYLDKLQSQNTSAASAASAAPKSKKKRNKKNGQASSASESGSDQSKA